MSNNKMTTEEFISWCSACPWYADDIYVKRAIKDVIDNNNLVKAAEDYMSAKNKFFDLLDDLIKKAGERDE